MRNHSTHHYLSLLNSHKSIFYYLPVFLILFSQMLWVSLTNDFQPVKLNIDSKNYFNFDWSFPAIFAQIRTFGYPLFVDFIRFFDPEFISLPIIQYLIYMGVVLFLALTLAHVGLSRIVVCLAISPFIYSDALHNYYFLLLADSLACSMAILSIGFYLLSILKFSNKALWVTLGFFIFLTYSIRPAYLFLIGFFPILSILLSKVVPEIQKSNISLKKVLIKTLLACLLPFFIFCSFRFFVYGHFGFVSFGGHNLNGLVSSFLTPADVKKLPLEAQEMANDILNQKRADGVMISDEPLVISYEMMHENYNKNVNYASRYNRRAGATNAVEQNENNKKYSYSLLLLHKKDYLKWLKVAGTKIYRRTSSETIVFYCFPFVLLFLIIRALKMAFAKHSLSLTKLDRDFLTLLILGFLFMALKSILVILVEIPLNRYMHPAKLFIPGIFLVGMFTNLWALLVQKRKKEENNL